MWEIEFYQTENGKIPVNDFLQELEPSMLAKALREIDMLKELGIDLRYPHSKSLGDRLFELRISSKGDISRIIYFHFSGNRFVLLHGFVKKTQATPKNEKEIAIKYMKDYRRRSK